ncbi:hypothetical protein OCA5_c02450 [Afipia carboxidovorans OM5]|uniref:Uncharacterized protein n=1 Tax=Afipia carboxidovorans (strain ATCC 49405 / DSM 1227 / KCTC 32145 / OM5) TaxID=504832 RepID=F8BSU7_AFIC5|nr:hypothetical protein OCA4_c02440 [Afipia carboxidovorans OM4]AEI04974.1 hypothetical protein OCA5_c02450 [Afipia carboxidovorans OM5]
MNPGRPAGALSPRLGRLHGLSTPARGDLCHHPGGFLKRRLRSCGANREKGDGKQACGKDGGQYRTRHAPCHARPRMPHFRPPRFERRKSLPLAPLRQ